ncbi:MAG: homoserine kinase [Chloroflexi bacterium]|nr:homoserine kinase [Chloroflexota bacterium]
MNEIQKVTVRVPATTANIGPGFDCLGLALDIWSELTVERGPFSVTMNGEGAIAASMPLDRSNLVVIATEAAFNAAGKPIPELTYRSGNGIPYSRGLGSSSAAIVAGLLAGAKLAGVEFEQEQLIKLAADLDGHPDNVAPAILGGMCVGIQTELDAELDLDPKPGRWITNQIKLPDDLQAVIFVPDLEGPTREARALLAPEVSRADAIFNAGRTALIVSAFANGRLDLLRYATEDRLHQPARSKVYPAMNRLIESSYAGGAHAAFLSGAGPSVVALATTREMTVIYEMHEAARQHNLPGKAIVAKPAATGAYVANAE